MTPEELIDLYAQVVKDANETGTGWIKVTRVGDKLQFERVRGSYAHLFDGEVDLLEEVVTYARTNTIDERADRSKALAIIEYKLRRGKA
jgi:hypothetical protein